MKIQVATTFLLGITLILQKYHFYTKIMLLLRKERTFYEPYGFTKN